MATGSSKGAGVAFACIVPLLGVGVLAISIHSAYSTHRKLSQGVQVDGTVVQIVQTRDPRDNFTVYKSAIRFRGEDGRFHTFLSAASDAPRYKAGQHVTVIYDKGHLEQARIEPFFQLYALTSFGILFGAAMIAWGVLAFLQMRRGMGPPNIRISSVDISP